MNCELAGRLIDDYLRDELSHRDRQLLEKHIGGCARCAAELRGRPAFERNLRRALAASVHPLMLSPDTSARIVQVADHSLRGGIRARRAAVTLQLVAGAVTTILLVVGLYSLFQQLPMPFSFNRAALFPATRLPLADGDPAALSAGQQTASQTMAASVQQTTRATLLFEPQAMRPRQPFTMTVFIENGTPQALLAVRLDLDISGPTGSYRFVWAVKGPVPAGGASAVRLTPERLAAPCQEQYQISPTDLFGQPGVYTLRLTLMDPAVFSR